LNNGRKKETRRNGDKKKFVFDHYTLGPCADTSASAFIPSGELIYVRGPAFVRQRPNCSESLREQAAWQADVSRRMSDVREQK
jgi:hypothetical protein